MSNAKRTAALKQALVSSNEVIADETEMLNRSQHSFMLCSTAPKSARNVAHISIDYKAEKMSVSVYDHTLHPIVFSGVKSPKHLKRMLRAYSII